MINFRSTAKFDKQATIVLVDQKQLKNKRFNFSNAKVRDELLAVSAAGQFNGESGESFPVVINKKVVVFVGVGQSDKISLTELRIIVRQVLLSANLKKIKEVEIAPQDKNEEKIAAIIEAFCIGTYTWKKYKSPSKDDKSSGEKSVYIAAAKKKSFEETITTALGVNLTRDLINDNADTVTSSHIERVIKGLVKGKKNISVETLNRKELKAKGLNLHLAVNQGSVNEPKLIIVKYNGAAKSAKYTALVGKGMTFDTGGLNIKPTGHIETMKCDMSGAAAVVGTLKNTINLKLKKNILFAVGLAENVTGSTSYKPGDVFKSYNGKTVEIGNTDAEGRLVLADAISYIVKNYKPQRIIDIATLTGACVVALGHDYTGLVSTDDKFARELVRSSNTTDDRVWRLPTYPELKDSVKSNIADIRNLGFPRGAAGTLTAAEFLRQFTDDTLWAHLDIAGTAYNDGHGRMYYGHGATGAGVRLLTHYLKTY